MHQIGFTIQKALLLILLYRAGPKVCCNPTAHLASTQAPEIRVCRDPPSDQQEHH